MLFSSRSLSIIATLATLLFAVAILLDDSSAVDGSANRPEPASVTRQKPSSRANSTAKSKPGQTAQRRLREGTQISSESGYFRLDGDGATFVADSGFEFRGLPNLNLERVVRILKNAEDPECIRWTVNGSVTEFPERNFLLISRAIYKSVAQPPLPEQLQ